jgi:hypothetical protein
MKTSRPATVFVILALAIAGFTRAEVEPITGSVVSVYVDSMTVRTAPGIPRTLTILLSPSTKLLKGGAEVSQRDLKIGIRVVVSAKASGDRLEARSVFIKEQPAHLDNLGPLPRPAPRYNVRQYFGEDSSWNVRAGMPASLRDDLAS